MKHAFAGVRPLPYSPDNKPSAVTRQHILHDHADDGAARMLSVIGGKLTTAASLARECARKIGLKVVEPNAMAMGPGPALDPLLDDAVLEIARIGAVSEETARGMLEWHGKRAADIARMALVSAELRAPICPHTSHVIAEVVESYRRECAVTLSRRTLAPCTGGAWDHAGRSPAAAKPHCALAQFLAGMITRWARNLEAFEMERAAFLRPVVRARAALEAAAD